MKNVVLYYMKRILLSKGVDYVGIDLRYKDNQEFITGDNVKRKELFKMDMDLVTRVLVEESVNYDMIILSGKSMGTTLIQSCLKEPEIMAKAVVIHMTPGTAWSDGIEQLKHSKLPMLLVGSTADGHYRVENLHEIYLKKNLTLVEFDHCDHLLETDDIYKDIERVAVIMNAVDGFIENQIGMRGRLYEHSDRETEA